MYKIKYSLRAVKGFDAYAFWYLFWVETCSISGKFLSKAYKTRKNTSKEVKARPQIDQR